MVNKKIAVVIGAGPAGLTAAYELLARTGIHPVVLEQDPTYVGGISRTVNYKGNRMDVGGHRFFSKSDRVMRWWAEMLPVRLTETGTEAVTYQNTTRTLAEGLRRATPADGSNVLWVRPRKSRILHGGKFIDYPVALSLDTLRKLGPAKAARILTTYLRAALFPRRPEKSLEDFFLNRFGRELYETFFKSYTEKVWGVPCRELSAEWGAQRVKGLSISRAILHAAKKLARPGPAAGKGVETSLVEQFLYPTYGPGQMWEATAEKIRALGGEIHMGSRVSGLTLDGARIREVRVETPHGPERIHADYVFSTTDIRALLRMIPDSPAEAHRISEALHYRAFLTVGLLLEKKPEEGGVPLSDTWVYVHEPGVRAGRIQLYHNWHPKLVAHERHGWLGLEYFANEEDELWRMEDGALIQLGVDELKTIGLRQGIGLVDATVIRQPKAYPGYFGSYAEFPKVRSFLDTLPNLFAIGRNGMHRYNNQDHSMLAAMTAVDNVLEGRTDRSNLWSVNTEDEYHEHKRA